MYHYSMEFLHSKVVGSIPASAINFLFDISFIWGNEPNGEQEQQQEQEQLK